VLQTPAYAALRAAIAAAPPGAGLTPVYADRGMRIFELPGAQPYLSAPGCRLAPRSRDELRADCAAPAPLTRLELMMRGWRATIDGHPVPIRLTGEIFQQVDLPAGASVVRFAYRPPWLGWATAAFVAGWLLLAATLRMGRGRERSPAELA